MFLLTPFYLIFALIMMRYFMKRYTGQHKWRRFLLLAFLFYLPVGWDVILGRTYFHYLCNKDGGVHIYQTVELEPVYWNEDGSPKFHMEGKWFDSSVFGERYVVDRKNDQYSEKLLDIARYSYQIIDSEEGKLLGEWVRYTNFGGWVMNTFNPFGQSGTSCPSTDEITTNLEAKGVGNKDYQKFTSFIFLRKSIAFKKGEGQ